MTRNSVREYHVSTTTLKIDDGSAWPLRMRSQTVCTAVVSELPDGVRRNGSSCSSRTPAPDPDCIAPILEPLRADTGWTISFSAFLELQDYGPKPYFMGLLSQCDCVCNRADARYEPLHHGGFLLGATNCLDPLNYSDPKHPSNSHDPHCDQDQYTNLSFYLANTNFTSPDGRHINASVDHGRIHGTPSWTRFWVEGPPMRNGEWNQITVVWQPTSPTELDTGTLNLTVFNPKMGPTPRTTSHPLVNASNIVPPAGTPFDVGTSRFPNREPCSPFFGKLRGLKVWNGVGCSKAPDALLAHRLLKTDDGARTDSTFRWSTVHGNGMVLQSSPRQSTVWGLCPAGDTVSISLDGGAPTAASVGLYLGPSCHFN